MLERPIKRDPDLRILEAIRDINASADRDEVIKVYMAFTAAYGFEKVMIGHLVNLYNMPPEERLFVTDWPDDLIQYRIATDALLHDPVAIKAMRTTRTFEWAETFKDASKKGRAIVEEARDYQIKEGIMVPVHAPGSVSGGVSLGAAKLDLPKVDIEGVEIVTRQVYLKLESLLGPFPYQKAAKLSRREIEVVQLVAGGKTSWDIAALLGVKEDTVNKTMKRAAVKLGAVNRPHAVAKAIAQKLIFP